MFHPRGQRQERFVAVAAELADRFALDAADKVRTGAFPSANFDAIRGKSVPRMVVPAEPGGLGANLLETVMTVERLASVQRHLWQAARGDMAAMLPVAKVSATNNTASYSQSGVKRSRFQAARGLFSPLSQILLKLFPNFNLLLLDNRHKVIYNVGQSGELWGELPRSPFNRQGWWGKHEVSVHQDDNTMRVTCCMGCFK